MIRGAVPMDMVTTAMAMAVRPTMMGVTDSRLWMPIA